MSLFPVKNLDPLHPGEGITEKKLPHADLILSLALESNGEGGLESLGFGKGRAREESERAG